MKKTIPLLRQMSQETIRHIFLIEFGVILSITEMDFVLRKIEHTFEFSWSYETCRTWLKNRACDLGKFPHGERTPFGDVTTCTLHVFFISIEETAEHLRLLQNEIPGQPNVAASKIFDQSSRLPVAIDRTAQRVAPNKMKTINE